MKIESNNLAEILKRMEKLEKQVMDDKKEINALKQENSLLKKKSTKRNLINGEKIYIFQNNFYN